MQYFTNAAGKFVLVDGGEVIAYPDGLEEVAILYDEDGFILLKHGEPSLVRARFIKMKEAFHIGGHSDLASNLKIVQGKFSEEKLNRVLSTTGYLKTFVAEVNAIDVTVLAIEDSGSQGKSTV